MYKILLRIKKCSRNAVRYFHVWSPLYILEVVIVLLYYCITVVALMVLVIAIVVILIVAFFRLNNWFVLRICHVPWIMFMIGWHRETQPVGGGRLGDWRREPYERCSFPLARQVLQSHPYIQTAYMLSTSAGIIPCHIDINEQLSPWLRHLLSKRPLSKHQRQTDT